MSEVWIQPTGGALGADVHGVDIGRGVSDAAFARIAEAWAEHLVLRFSGQRITDDQLMEFSKRFGELDRVPIATAGLDRTDSGLDENARQWVAVISSVKENGKAVGGLGSYELVWHTDMSYNDLPPRASLLYAVEVPPDGGNTGYLNMYTAYETLPGELKRAIEGKTCIHDSSRNSAGELRKGFQRTTDVTRTPGAVHPLVRTMPRTGRRALYLASHAAHIVDWPVPEGRLLLLDLMAHATLPQFVYRHVWRPHDFVIWDNRCALHSATGGYPIEEKRIHWRVTIMQDAAQSQKAA